MTTDTSTIQLLDIQKQMVETVRIQLVAVNALTKALSDWAVSADKYSGALNEELKGISESGAISTDAMSSIASRTNEYLMELSELPNKAARQFGSDLEKLLKPESKRTRQGKAKE